MWGRVSVVAVAGTRVMLFVWREEQRLCRGGGDGRNDYVRLHFLFFKNEGEQVR